MSVCVSECIRDWNEGKERTVLQNCQKQRMHEWKGVIVMVMIVQTVNEEDEEMER